MLFVFEQYAAGGFESHIDTLIEHLVRRDVGVYCIGGPDFAASPVRSMVRQYATVDMQTFSAEGVRRAAEQVAEILTREGIEVAHIHPHASLLPGAIGCMLAGVRYVVTFHGAIDVNQLATHAGGFALQSTAQFVLPNASCVTCVAENSAAKISSTYGYPRGRIVVSRNPIDLTRFPFMPPSHDAPKNVVVLSRLDEDKYRSVRAALELVRELRRLDPSWQAVVAGSGNRATDLHSYASELGLTDVRFPGFLADVPALVQSASLVIGMGRVVLESIASGRPAVLSGSNGLVGLVTPSNFDYFRTQNFNPRTVPPSSPGGVARRLTEPQTLDEMLALRERVAGEFSADSICDQWLDVYAAESEEPSKREGAREAIDWLGQVGNRSLRTLHWAVDQRSWPSYLLGAPSSSGMLKQALSLRQQDEVSCRDRLNAQQATNARHTDRIIRLEEDLERTRANLFASQANAQRLANQLVHIRRDAEQKQFAADAKCTYAAIQRYSETFDQILDVYRGQKAWKLMLAVRRAYTMITRGGWKSRMRLLLGPRPPIGDYELSFPSLSSYFPPQPGAVLTDQISQPPTDEMSPRSTDERSTEGSGRLRQISRHPVAMT